MLADFEIFVEHGEPVSIAAISDILSIIADASEIAALEVIDSAVLRTLDLPDEFMEALRTSIHDEKSNSFWLYSVEPGSSKFKGKIGGLLMTLILMTAGKISGNAAWDVIKDTDLWRHVQPRAVEITNNFTNAIGKNLQALAKKQTDHDQLVFEVEIVGDRIRLRVRPSRKQFNIVTLG